MCDSPVPNSPLKGWAIYPKFLLHCIINMHSIDIAENCWNSRFIFPIAFIHVFVVMMSLPNWAEPHCSLNGHQQPWRCSWLNLAKRKSMKTSARSERSAWCLRKKGWKTVTQTYSAIKKKKEGLCSPVTLQLYFSLSFFVFIAGYHSNAQHTYTHLTLTTIQPSRIFFFFFSNM